jgi:ATP-dependent RNA helicase RhlE
MKFTDFNINTPLLNAIDELGLAEATPIQINAFSPIMAGRDVVGIAHTGTGKTFAYLLPILRQHQYSEKKHPKVLIIVPTRELVNQVVREIEKLTKYITIRVAGVYGGETMSTQMDRISEGLDVLVATPVRAKDLAHARAFKLKEIKKLVIDEVDEMFNLGFRPQLFDLLENLPDKRQNIMFSATLNSEIEEMISHYFYAPDIIEVAEHGETVEKVEQFGFYVPNFYTKLNLLDRLLTDDEEMQRVLVFVQNKWTANAVIEHMDLKYGASIRVIHSNKSQNYRAESIDGFQTGKYRILVATDVIARGIDFIDVSHVVNLGIPEPESYIHRIGRTGRAGKEGIAISIASEYERREIEMIEEVINREIQFFDMPDDIEIATKLSSDEINIEEEKQRGGIKAPSLKHGQGAFHEKKLKNQKENWEGLSKEAYKRKYNKR